MVIGVVMSKTLTSLLLASIASFLTPLLAKIVGNLLLRRIKSNSHYIPVKIKVGHAKRDFRFEITKDLKNEDIDRIVKYLVDIEEIEKAPSVQSIDVDGK